MSESQRIRDNNNKRAHWHSIQSLVEHDDSSSTRSRKEAKTLIIIDMNSPKWSLAAKTISEHAKNGETKYYILFKCHRWMRFQMNETEYTEKWREQTETSNFMQVMSHKICIQMILIQNYRRTSWAVTTHHSAAERAGEHLNPMCYTRHAAITTHFRL